MASAQQERHGLDEPSGRTVRGSLPRRAWTLLTASDPGLGRLRSAATTVATLLVALGVLYGVVTLLSQPLTSAVLGVVVAMIASLAVDEPDTRRRAASIALLVPCAAATAALASALSSHQVVADAGFVAVAVGAVLLRRLGPRGTPMGMVGFIGYFLALFVRLTVDQLPVAVLAVAVGALLAFLMGLALRPRHPDRDLQRMLAALGARAGGVLDALRRDVAEEPTPGWPTGRLRSRLAACGETAWMVEQRLDAAGEQLVSAVGNDTLSVRVFDFQLAVEHLVATAAHAAQLPVADRARAAELLDQAAGRLVTTEGWSSGSGAAGGGPDGPVGGRHPGALGDLLWSLDGVLRGWRQLVDPRSGEDGPAAPDGAPAGASSSDAHPRGDEERNGDADGDAEDPSPQTSWSDTGRQATQVGLAAALAIVVGELISSTRWFWAAISAFVVFTGTATSGETLSKGWQRVVGTLAGVVAGVVVAAFVGGDTVVAVVLIVACVFLGVYLMRVSSAWMIFFITTMLALLYGLLGQFSVELLLVRLEETAAGAAIGVLVSFVVFPSSTRGAVRDGAGHFLTELGDLLADLRPTLAGEPTTGSSAQAEASALRESFDAVKSAAKPLTDGLAGLGNRSDHRRTLSVLGACEHHARALSRLADAVAWGDAGPDVHRVLSRAVDAVRANGDALAHAVEPGDGAGDADGEDDADGAGRDIGVSVQPADEALDALDRLADAGASDERGALQSVGRHLRAIDQAVCGFAADPEAGPAAGRRIGAGPAPARH